MSGNPILENYWFHLTFFACWIFMLFKDLTKNIHLKIQFISENWQGFKTQFHLQLGVLGILLMVRYDSVWLYLSTYNICICAVLACWIFMLFDNNKKYLKCQLWTVIFSVCRLSLAHCENPREWLLSPLTRQAVLPGVPYILYLYSLIADIVKLIE